MTNPVNHPRHYVSHPSGIECIQITEHMGFNLGNAIKYLWRADLKGDAIEDLKKAKWYLDREIAKREKAPYPQLDLPDTSLRSIVDLTFNTQEDYWLAHSKKPHATTD